MLMVDALTLLPVWNTWHIALQVLVLVGIDPIRY